MDSYGFEINYNSFNQSINFIDIFCADLNSFLSIDDIYIFK